jgi:hypothetical protein
LRSIGTTVQPFPHGTRRLLLSATTVVVSLLLGSVYSMGPRAARLSRASGSRASVSSRWDSAHAIVGREASHDSAGHEVPDAGISSTRLSAGVSAGTDDGFVQWAEPALDVVRANPPPGLWTLLGPPDPISLDSRVFSPSRGRAPPRS